MADISKIQVPIDGVMTELNIKGSGGSANYYGTCTGQASNQIKAVTISNDQGFELKTGVLIFVKFDANYIYNATSSSPIKLNVNNTGEKQIYADDTATPTGTNTTFFGKMNCINQYVYNGTYWVWNGTSSEDEGGSGSGGHTIIDESGTSLAQEPNLQFKGADVSDDSTNNRTVVDMSYTEIDYEDWLELTEQEKETGRWDVVGVPGADGTVSFDLMTKLWENPDPTQTYSTGTITLSSSDYDLLLFQFTQTNTNTNIIISAITKKGKNVLAEEIVLGASNPCRTRVCEYVSDTSYDVQFAYVGKADSSSTASQSSNALIPYQIYGVKISQTVEIKAIATEVSTSASKCMMSDGETSVEDAIEELQSKGYVSVIADGVKTYSQLLDSLFSLIDMTKISEQSVFVISPQIYRASYISVVQLIFFNISMNTSHCYINQYLLKASDSSALSKDNANNPTNNSSVVLTSGVELKIVY